MTRAKYFFSALFAGYASLAANFFFTFLSVPIALHFLSKEQFGLWALVVQLGGYLVLVDLGMSTSVARFLADFKDSKDQGAACGNHVVMPSHLWLHPAHLAPRNQPVSLLDRLRLATQNAALPAPSASGEAFSGSRVAELFLGLVPKLTNQPVVPQGVVAP
jgi:hypothetical protein